MLNDVVGANRKTDQTPSADEALKGTLVSIKSTFPLHAWLQRRCLWAQSSSLSGLVLRCVLATTSEEEVKRKGCWGGDRGSTRAVVGHRGFHFVRWQIKTMTGSEERERRVYLLSTCMYLPGHRRRPHTSYLCSSFKEHFKVKVCVPCVWSVWETKKSGRSTPVRQICVGTDLMKWIRVSVWRELLLIHSLFSDWL